jgi:hypothetical protein
MLHYIDPVILMLTRSDNNLVQLMNFCHIDLGLI